jgi:hypothetical protein
MSYHFGNTARFLGTTLRQIERRSRLHPPVIYAPGVYLGCLTASTGARLFIIAVAERALAGERFMPSQKRLGQLYHRSERSIRRWIRTGVEAGWLRVIRRGRKMTNLYRLSRYLWGRLTGRYKTKIPEELQTTLFNLGLKLGLAPATMQRSGVNRE